MYSDAPDNPKIGAMTDEKIGQWLKLMCVAARYDGQLPDVSKVAFHLRCSPDRVQKMVSVMVQTGLFDEAQGVISPHDWDEWQRHSDDSTARVKAFRQRRKAASGNGNETLPQRSGNDPGNGPEQSRADTEQKQSRTEERAHDFSASKVHCDVWADRLYAHHIKRKNRALIEGCVLRIVQRCLESGVDPEAKLEEIDRCLIAWNQTAAWRDENGRFAPSLDKWLEDDGFDIWPDQSH